MSLTGRPLSEVVGPNAVLANPTGPGMAAYPQPGAPGQFNRAAMNVEASGASTGFDTLRPEHSPAALV